MTRLLALDVDGVLLDPERGGDGHWTNELERRHGISRAQLREHFFVPSWEGVVTGRCELEPALVDALAAIGTDVSARDVIDCWHEADFVLVGPAVELARSVADVGVPVVLATNQSHERAAHLRAALSRRFAISDVWYSAEFGVQKPEAAFFERAAGRLDRSTQVVFVDDSAGNVRSASEAGWTAVAADASLRWIDEVVAELGLPKG